MIRVAKDKDRPVPQVQAVRAATNLNQRPPAQQRSKPESRWVHNHHDGENRQHRNQGQQPLVHIAGGEFGHAHNAHEQRERNGAKWIESCAELEHLASGPPWSPDERCTCAEQQAAGSRERAEVHEVGAVGLIAKHRDGAVVWRGGVQHEHQRHQRERCSRKRLGSSAEATSAYRHRGDEHQRPNQVPLLFDGKRPEVAKQWRIG